MERNLNEQLIELIIEKTKGYGTPSQPMTIGIFNAILEDVKQDLVKNRKKATLLAYN